MYATANRFVKVNFSVFAGAVVTLSLFYFMQLLIQVDADRPQVALVFKVIDATMPDIKPELIEVIKRPEPMQEPEEEETPVENRAINPGSGFALAIPDFDPDIELPALAGLGISDSSMIPLMRTTAPYPTRALQNNVQGFVIVEFTVNALGNVEDARVIYAEPEGYFERAALQTIAKWRYAPRVENGSPVPVRNVQQRISFEIAQ